MISLISFRFVSFVVLIALLIQIGKNEISFAGDSKTNNDVPRTCIDFGEEMCERYYGSIWKAEMAWERKIHIEGKSKLRALTEIYYSYPLEYNIMFMDGFRKGVKDTFVPIVGDGSSKLGDGVGLIPTPEAQALSKLLKLYGEGNKTMFAGAELLSDYMVKLTRGGNEEEMNQAFKGFLCAAKDLGYEFIPWEKAGLGTVSDGRLGGKSKIGKFIGKSPYTKPSKVFEEKFLQNFFAQLTQEELQGVADIFSNCNNPTIIEMPANLYAHKQIVSAMKHFDSAGQTFNTNEFAKGFNCLETAKWVITDKNKSFAVEISSDLNPTNQDENSTLDFSDEQKVILEESLGLVKSADITNPDAMKKDIDNINTHLQELINLRVKIKEGDFNKPFECKPGSYKCLS